MNVSLIVSSEVQIFTYRSNSSQIIFSQSFNNVHSDVHSFRERRYCDWGGQAKPTARGTLQSRGHGCDVAWNQRSVIWKILKTLNWVLNSIWFFSWHVSILTWLVKLRCSLDKFMCSWNCWSGKICLLPNFAGIEFGLIWCLCSLWMCLLTVLFLVKDLWQKGQGTLIPWCLCRMWALRLVS